MNGGGGRLALFDLDGTLLTGDTDTLWCNFLIDAGVLDAAVYSARNQEVTERYAAGEIEAADYCGFYAGLLAGRSADQWAPLRQRFVTAVVAPRLPEAARALVDSHRDAGDALLLTTATNRFLAEPIAAAFGIGNVIATELAQSGALFDGRNRGTLNMQAGKVERLHAWLAEAGRPLDALAAATFYSDSINDLPLLAAVGQPVAVDPDARLLAEAERQGWPVLHLPRA